MQTQLALFVVDAVITSPPYANNYDDADALRFEMTFWGDASSWGDIHDAVRKHLIVSSFQHASRERLRAAESPRNHHRTDLARSLVSCWSQLCDRILNRSAPHKGSIWITKKRIGQHVSERNENCCQQRDRIDRSAQSQYNKGRVFFVRTVCGLGQP
jgi:hypothetical protein